MKDNIEESPSSLIKDEIYLTNVKKIGNSVKNINIINNVISKPEHKELLDFATSISDWEKQPWNVYTFSSSKMPTKIINILSKIFKIAEESVSKFYDVGVTYEKSQTINIIKFEEGYGMHLHVDTFSYAQFHIASVYYINDDYTGGEINFPDHNFIVKPEANSLIIFPGNENYWHETFKVAENDRYTSTRFFQFVGSKFSGHIGNGKYIYEELKDD